MNSKRFDIHFAVGSRSELDLKFRAVLEREKPEDMNISDFMKTTVVGYYEEKWRRENEVSAVEKVRRDFELRLKQLEDRIGSGIVVTPPPIDNEKQRVVQSKVKALMVDGF